MRNHSSCYLILATSVALAAMPAAAAAEDCALKLEASVDLTTTPSGAALVPVRLAGANKKFLLDTGGYLSVVTSKTADELGLSRRTDGVFEYDASGQPLSQHVTVSDFNLGGLRSSSTRLMVGAVPGADGTLAPNLLTAYDVELDFPHNKFALISQDHCKGQVIHWPASAIAVVPMHVTETGHIIFPITMDGHNLQALLDTSAAQTTLSARTASRVFGIATSGTHRFKTLSFEGVTVNNPEIAVSSNITRVPRDMAGKLASSDPVNEMPDILVGMSTLKHLHLHIAYKEQTLYITVGEGAPSGKASGR